MSNEICCPDCGTRVGYLHKLDCVTLKKLLAAWHEAELRQYPIHIHRLSQEDVQPDVPVESMKRVVDVNEGEKDE